MVRVVSFLRAIFLSAVKGMAREIEHKLDKHYG
jgi:hypothetical protein